MCKKVFNLHFLVTHLMKCYCLSNASIREFVSLLKTLTYRAQTKLQTMSPGHAIDADILSTTAYDAALELVNCTEHTLLNTL